MVVRSTGNQNDKLRITNYYSAYGFCDSLPLLNLKYRKSSIKPHSKAAIFE